jgi:hypothetical protein
VGPAGPPGPAGPTGPAGNSYVGTLRAAGLVQADLPACAPGAQDAAEGTGDPIHLEPGTYSPVYAGAMLFHLGGVGAPFLSFRAEIVSGPSHAVTTHAVLTRQVGVLAGSDHESEREAGVFTITEPTEVRVVGRALVLDCGTVGGEPVFDLFRVG